MARTWPLCHGGGWERLFCWTKSNGVARKRDDWNGGAREDDELSRVGGRLSLEAKTESQGMSQEGGPWVLRFGEIERKWVGCKNRVAESGVLEGRKTEKVEKEHHRVRLFCFSWVFVIIIAFLYFLPTTWVIFVDFVMLNHLELCWLWPDYMFVVVDTSSVLFGFVRIQLISILFSLCGICSIDLFYSTSSPPYMFKPMDWNMKCDFCWFILFPPFMLYFFYCLYYFWSSSPPPLKPTSAHPPPISRSIHHYTNL